ncbi:MAG: hypothetical protein AAB886_01955 [Patescibacteria group bacterium]
MNSRILKQAIAVLSLTLVVFGSTAASANALSYYIPRNLLADGQEWTLRGQASRNPSGSEVTLVSIGNETSSATKTISIPAYAERDYGILISYTKAEDVRDEITQNGKRDITGLPYVYGMYTDGNGQVLQYLEKTTTRHRGTTDGKWAVTYGVFKIPTGAKNVIVSLNQALYAGKTYDGKSANFKEPAFIIVRSKAQANRIKSEYRKHLYTDLLPDITRLFTTPPSYPPPTPPVIPPTPPVVPPTPFSVVCNQFLKASESPTIWLVCNNGTRHAFRDAKTYLTYDPNWSRLVTVPLSTIAGYKEGRLAPPKNKYVMFSDGIYYFANGPELVETEIIMFDQYPAPSGLGSMLFTYPLSDKSLYDTRRTTTDVSPDACGTVASQYVISKTGFEAYDTVDSRFGFGSLLPTWSSTVLSSGPDYNFGALVNGWAFDQAKEGARSLGVTNPRNSGYDMFDEAIGYDVNGIFGNGEKYEMAVWVKYVGPNGSVPITFAKERVSTSGIREMEYEVPATANDGWKCVSIRGSRSLPYSNTAERLSLFFGKVPQGGTLYLDKMQLIRK